MDKQWPPPAPHIKKAFEKAHDAKPENALQPNAPAIVTKKQVEDLEKQPVPTSRHMHLLPPGVRPPRTVDPARLARLENMKQRLKQNKGKARDDFGRSAEHQL
jgi:hypothetical protein